MKSDLGQYDSFLKNRGSVLANDLKDQIESNRLRKLDDVRQKHKKDKME